MNNEVIKKLQIKNGKLQIQIERLKLDKEEYYLDYLDLQQRIDKAIETLEKRIEENEEIDYVDMTGKSYINFQKEIIDILRGEDNEEI